LATFSAMSWVTRFGRVPSVVVLAASTAVVVLGLGASMAAAAPNSTSTTNSAQHSKALTCTPNHPKLGDGCAITFHDGSDAKGYGGVSAKAHRQVCFTVNRDGDHVRGQTENCSLTNEDGTAHGVFVADVCGAATITATEGPEPGEPHGTATKTVVVTGGSCSQKGGHGD
jgi:hypothetical protein